MVLCSRLFLFCGLIASGGLSAVALGQSTSPFMPPTKPGQAAPVTENPPVVFAGVLGEGEDARFCLVIPERRQTAWVKAGEDGYPFTVQSYDPEEETVSVLYGGQSLNLKLQAAKIAAAPANQVGPTPAPNNNDSLTSTVVVNPTPADEQRRLEAVAAEVRRRRALRAAAAQQQNAGNKK